MIKIDHTVAPSIEQWKAVIRGARNPFNSWDRSDSREKYVPLWDEKLFDLGDKDKTLLNRLANAGDDHGKFLRMLPVITDITADFTFWKQLDTYKVGTVSDSCSTMHTILNDPFSIDNFNCSSAKSVEYISQTVDHLNVLREEYFNQTDDDGRKKIWQAVIENLPMSYLQKRTWFANYQVLRRIFYARSNHKLSDWHDFCTWIMTLPYAKELILGEME